MNSFIREAIISLGRGMLRTLGDILAEHDSSSSNRVEDGFHEGDGFLVASDDRYQLPGCCCGGLTNNGRGEVRDLRTSSGLLSLLLKLS
jgi:hypothetical protein